MKKNTNMKMYSKKYVSNILNETPTKKLFASNITTCLKFFLFYHIKREIDKKILKQIYYARNIRSGVPNLPYIPYEFYDHYNMVSLPNLDDDLRIKLQRGLKLEEPDSAS